jgi:hypothetical protein
MAMDNKPFELTEAFYNAVLSQGPMPRAVPVATVDLPTVGGPGSKR